MRLAIRRGIATTKEATQAVRDTLTEEYEATLSLVCATAEFEDPQKPNDAHMPETKIPIRSGGEFHMRYKVENFKPVYRDEYTGETLPSELVHKAMCEELD